MPLLRHHSLAFPQAQELGEDDEESSDGIGRRCDRLMQAVVPFVVPVLTFVAVNAGNEENPGDPTGRAAAGEVKVSISKSLWL